MRQSTHFLVGLCEWAPSWAGSLFLLAAGPGRAESIRRLWLACIIGRRRLSGRIENTMSNYKKTRFPSPNGLAKCPTNACMEEQQDGGAVDRKGQKAPRHLRESGRRTAKRSSSASGGSWVVSLVREACSGLARGAGSVLGRQFGEKLPGWVERAGECLAGFLDGF